MSAVIQPRLKKVSILTIFSMIIKEKILLYDLMIWINVYVYNIKFLLFFDDIILMVHVLPLDF